MSKCDNCDLMFVEQMKIRSTMGYSDTTTMSKCDKCEARIYFARMFDIHIEQDDCPYDCPYDCEKEENKNGY